MACVTKCWKTLVKLTDACWTDPRAAGRFRAALNALETDRQDLNLYIDNPAEKFCCLCRIVKWKTDERALFACSRLSREVVNYCSYLLIKYLAAAKAAWVLSSPSLPLFGLTVFHCLHSLPKVIRPSVWFIGLVSSLSSLPLHHAQCSCPEGLPRHFSVDVSVYSTVGFGYCGACPTWPRAKAAAVK